jgi:hypothetical protein
MVLWGLLAAEPLIRAATWIYQTGGFFVHDADVFSRSIYYGFHTHCDGLIMGLILSHVWVYREKTAVPDASRQRRRGLLMVAGAFVAMALLYLLQHEIFSFTGLALLFGALVWFGLTSGSRSFSSRIFYWISRLSFGMYLNHAYLVTFCVAVALPSIRIFRPGSVANQLFA